VLTVVSEASIMIAATKSLLHTVLQQRQKAKPVSDVRMGMRAPPKYAWPISSQKRLTRHVSNATPRAKSTTHTHTHPAPHQ